MIMDFFKKRAMNERVVILIPAYDPDEKLTALLAALTKTYAKIVVVDDGSTLGKEVFAAIDPKKVTLLAHDVNRGKGAALKTGFKWILENEPQVDGVITADADGQHCVEDIAKIAEALTAERRGLVLGVRAFAGKVPFRSRFGNWWTSLFFFLMTGLKVGDTQTGLRGIPTALLESIAALPGERYEYEMRMLAEARHHAEKPHQLPIETIYIEENRSSHFSPLKDSLKIWGALIGSRFGR